MDYIEKKLPHKYPVRFIKEVEIEREDDAISLVEFKEKPTLSALLEAGAQNTVFIQSLYAKFDGGVLSSIKYAELLAPFEAGVYRVKSSIVSRLDPFVVVAFVFLQQEDILAKGEINIVMNPRTTTEKCAPDKDK